VRPSRPLTHDLLKSVVENFQASISQIVIDELIVGTFFAKIHLESTAANWRIDARPSDAIALAVRAEAPIFAEESVLEQASVLTGSGEEEQVEQFRSFLQDIDPADFGSD
jgi:bifunctional DNase/RNase